MEILAIAILGIVAFIFTYLETKKFSNAFLRTIISFVSACLIAFFTSFFVDWTKEKLNLYFPNEEKMEANKDSDIDKSDKTTNNGDSNKAVSNEEDSEKEKQKEPEEKAPEKYLEDMPRIKYDRYTGNQGDSFVDKIGINQYTRGNVDVDGNEYTHGIEAWIARWNEKREISWAYSVYELEAKYSKLVGELVLIDSYNTTNFDATLYFYDASDDSLLKKYSLSPGGIPFMIDVDITDVKYLKIYVEDNVAVPGGTSFGLINLILTNE